MAGKKRVGIVLFQLGGPDSLESVEPFLLNLFLDPDIIPLGPLGLLRRPIAKLVASRRAIPVAGRYAQIGRRWLKPEVGDVKALLARYQEITERPRTVPPPPPIVTPQVDWWPAFVRAALGALEAGFREMALLALDDWAAREIVSDQLFTAVA